MTDADVPDAGVPAQLVVASTSDLSIRVERGDMLLGECPDDCSYGVFVGETISLRPVLEESSTCYNTIKMESADCDLSGDCCWRPGDGACQVAMEQACRVAVSCSTCL